MSDDLDFDMEVVGDDELDEIDADGVSNSEERSGSDAEKPGEEKEDSNTARISKEEIPEGWEAVQLGDNTYFQRFSGDTPTVGNPEYWGGGILWLSNSEVEDGEINIVDQTECSLTPTGLNECTAETIPPRSVILSCTASIGKVAINAVEMATNQQFNAFKPTGEVNAYYLANQFLRKKPELETIGGATTHNHLPVYMLEKVGVPKPPLPEQRKIASVLYAVDQAIQKTEEIIEQTKITKKGVLRRLYREGIRETELTHTPAGDTPEHWRISVLEDICDIGGGSTPRKKNEAYWGGNVLWASPKDFLGPVMQNTEDKLTEEGVDDCNSKVYEKGSTLIVVRSGILRRKLPIAKAGRPTTVNQDIKAVTPKDGEIDKEYLFQILHSHASRVRRNCMKVGTTVESIETSLLRKFPIKVPPLEEQKHIASIGFDFDQELRIEQEELKRLKRLKSGLMQDLLTGEVRTGDRAIEVLEEVQAHG